MSVCLIELQGDSNFEGIELWADQYDSDYVWICTVSNDAEIALNKRQIQGLCAALDRFMDR